MIRTTALLVTVIAALGSAGAAAAETTFTQVSRHYEAIPQSLLKDWTADIREHAQAIESIASQLARDFGAASAGVADSDAAALRELLPEIIEQAAALADADGLGDARRALAELTKPLVRFHRLVQGSRPIVVYCPMEKKSWLQPDEAIGNPYAPSMLRCGEVVQR